MTNDQYDNYDTGVQKEKRENRSVIANQNNFRGAYNICLELALLGGLTSQYDSFGRNVMPWVRLFIYEADFK